MTPKQLSVRGSVAGWDFGAIWLRPGHRFIGREEYSLGFWWFTVWALSRRSYRWKAAER